MKKFSIKSKADAYISIREPNDVTHIVSIKNKNDVFANMPHPVRDAWKNKETLLALDFDDATNAPEARRRGHSPPTRQDIETLIEFMKSVPPNAVVLFHCEAGISRSSAAALIGQAVHGVSTDNAMRALFAPFGLYGTLSLSFYPNALMMVEADAILGTRFEQALRNMFGSNYKAVQ